MANSEISFEKNTEKNLESFINRNRKVILTVIIAVVAAAIAVSLYFVVSANIAKKGVAAVEGIEYSYLKNAVNLSEEDADARQATALEALVPYLGKKNVAGVRANMLAADIAFSKADYASALTYYINAANAGKKSYTASLNYYNAAVCAEESDNNEDAVRYYEKAVSYSDFLLASHALFSLGRVKESMNDFAGAADSYQKIIDKYTDTWSNLANSRILSLRSEGKIN